MKKFLTLSMLSAAFLTSCKKTENLHNTPGSTSPAALMAKLIDIKSDFQINVSSSVGSSVYENSTVNNGVTVVEGYSSDASRVGTLTVNTQEIPFTTRTYFYQIDSTENPSLFTGRTNTYNLSGGAFPAFSIQDYSTRLTTMSFDGLTDHKLPAGSDLTINWIVDREFPSNGKAAIIVASENPQSKGYTTLYKEADQSSGVAKLSAAELSQFDNAAYVEVYFAKGSGVISEISNKKVAVKNLAYTYSRIYR